MDVVGFLHTIHEITTTLQLKSSDTLLDIGCGSGIITLTLSPWLSRIHGLDFSPRMIARAEGNCQDIPNVSFAVGNITDLEAPTASYSKVLAYSVLQYLPDREAVLKAFSEVARVLEPGGRALFAANPDPEKQDLNRARIEQSPLSTEQKAFNSRLAEATLWISPREMVDLAKSLGLKAELSPISPAIPQHVYMFNLVISHG
jgi:ubiquinone/menaquinone biosynthesis C-methylase UbiE